MEFETGRFIIRKLRNEDLEAFHDMQSNDDVMRYIKPPLNYEESKEELEKFIGYYSSISRFFTLWAIEDKSSQDFVGLCGVYENKSEENEIAYRLRTQFWGRGMGKEIVKALIEHCFGDLKLERIVAHVDERNIGSVRILEGEMNFVEWDCSEEDRHTFRKYELYSK